MKGSGTRFPVLIDPYAEDCAFPDVSLAMREPNGLLAVGGHLGPQCLLNAYRHGIFPWYEAGQPILWWSPDPRMVLFPERLRLARSLRRTIRRQPFRITFDAAFDAVMRACAEPRGDERYHATWITGEMIAAYHRLHRLGHARSVEAWEGETLVGGAYGVAIGRVFFGESMFHRRTDASKLAFVHLVRRLAERGCVVIDCQMETPHLASLGAESLPREAFLRLLSACDEPGMFGGAGEGV